MVHSQKKLPLGSAAHHRMKQKHKHMTCTRDSAQNIVLVGAMIKRYKEEQIETKSET